MTFHIILIIPLFLIFLDFYIQTCQPLIIRAFALHELPSLVEAVFSSTNANDAIRRLCVDDAQTVDVMDEVRFTLSERHPVDRN